MFVDQARIYVRSGDGGDGMIGFRREKYVPLGGPDGGDGGRGGDLILVAKTKLSGLAMYHHKTHYRAANGAHGGKSNKTGRSASALILEVPTGTVVRDDETGELLADLVEPDQELVVAPGGRGGRGNARFASSTNQAPRVAERGEPGAGRWIRLELKLIADVGIVGVPNAGKSTLLSVVSAARPKIADYPFTTLQPNLGVVELEDYQTMVWADIPGLIEGAHAGAGLGHDFLRHIERTRLLIHLLDGASEDPLSDWEKIDQELALYNPELARRPQVVVLNKLDLEDAALLWWPAVQHAAAARGLPALAISAVTGQGVRSMVYRVHQMLEELPAEATAPELPIIRLPADADAFAITQEMTDDVSAWRVSGARIERLAAMTYWEFSESTARFQRILERMGIASALREAGVQPGDTVLIGDEVLEWND
jgi:GTP-binding protein